MSTLTPRFLLIGAWNPALSEIGALLAPTLAESPLSSDFEVVGVTATVFLEKKFAPFWTELRGKNPCVQLVGSFPKGFSAQTLIQRHNEDGFFRVLDGTGLREAEPALYEALEEANRLRQDLELANMLQEQEKRLETLRGDLETRVEKRTRLLAESRHNLHLRSLRLEGLRKALLVVQEASSLSEMERVLNESLATTVETSWIRIVPAPQDSEFERQIAHMDGFAWKAVPLWRHQEKIGAAFYMRPKDRPFRKDDQDFLAKISEAVAMALDRLTKIGEAENLKEQWDTTFSSMADPVAIIDSSYEIIQSNTAARGKKCYEQFFNREAPCVGCKRGENFSLAEEDRFIEVQSQLLTLDSSGQSYYVNLYSDRTEQRGMEKRILESAKMAELGTIGSSIAHELNNPLGGVLNFAQLMLMDLQPEHPFHADIREIENGARRCKEIVENLLGFTRAPRSDEIREIDLRDVTSRALKILELRSKTLGIDVRFSFPAETCIIPGHLNLLSQAFKNLLERSIDSVLNRREKEATFKGRLVVDLRRVQDEARKREKFVLEISDDGLGEGTTAGRHGLALQIAAQILRDQGGDLEVSSPSSPDSWAKISFSRPVLES
ncbi:MAG: HAMP domain-containing histidine kinase [Bdellovibrionaceae bacterium]|nr:HAMP domain-containing histidine kinase [Pseudobdellovibrionaceae bacterium]